MFSARTISLLAVFQIEGLAESAGFRLPATGEINANPKDTKGQRKGVWALPRSFASGGIDRLTCVAFGGSDRMTL